MRIRISHLTSYRYDTPATSVIQMLRLTPRNHDGQFVARWRIDVSTDCRLDQHNDAFGNITHAFTAEGPFSELTIQVEGEVETRDTQGIVRGAVERFPPSLFLRETTLTSPDSEISAFAEANRDATSGDVLKLLHRTLERLHDDMTCDDRPGKSDSGKTDANKTYANKPTTTAAQTFARKRGACQDLAHVFIAASRSLGIPARCIAGYFRRDDDVSDQGAGHAWAEAYVPELGWVAFDVTNGICATDAHVRVAVGLDYLGATPLRGTCYGGAGEVLSVRVRVAQAAQQTQN
jgi:transglutaminase-like putative cysteine protease